MIVEYYRLWAGNAGDSGHWDVDQIEIQPGDAPVEAYDRLIKEACEKLEWAEGAPVIVGLYSFLEEPEFYLE